MAKKRSVGLLTIALAIAVATFGLLLFAPQPVTKEPSRLQKFTREMLAVINEGREHDPHPETRTYLKELYKERVRGALLIVVEDRHKEENGQVLAGVAAEYLRPHQTKSGKHEIHIFVPEFDRFQSDKKELRDVIISVLCHEWMHLETYRVYGKMLQEHPGKHGFTEFLVWTNQIRSQLLDWKKRGRFLAPSQHEAVAAYEQYYDKDERAWMIWVQEHLLY